MCRVVIEYSWEISRSGEFSLCNPGYGMDEGCLLLREGVIGKGHQHTSFSHYDTCGECVLGDME